MRINPVHAKVSFIFNAFQCSEYCNTVVFIAILPFFDILILSPATLLKKRLWHRSFPLNFAEFLRTPFFIEHFPRVLLKLKESNLIKRKMNYKRKWPIWSKRYKFIKSRKFKSTWLLLPWSNKALRDANTTSKLYQPSKVEHEKMLENNTTSIYKKANENIRKVMNKKGKQWKKEIKTLSV